MSDKETHGHFNESDSNSNRAETAGIDERYEKQLMYHRLHLNLSTIGVADGHRGSHQVDWRLLPILGALYSVALIDRLNVSSPAEVNPNEGCLVNVMGDLKHIDVQCGSRRNE